jgi:hypothetical protein
MNATLNAGMKDATLNPGTSDVRELTRDELTAVSGSIVRSVPNGRTDIIKAMGNTKW